MVKSDAITEAFMDELSKLGAGQVPFTAAPPNMGGSPGGPPIMPVKPTLKKVKPMPAMSAAPSSSAGPTGSDTPGGA